LLAQNLRPALHIGLVQALSGVNFGRNIFGQMLFDPSFFVMQESVFGGGEL
jgi:hypothetical protein